MQSLNHLLEIETAITSLAASKWIHHDFKTGTLGERSMIYWVVEKLGWSPAGQRGKSTTNPQVTQLNQWMWFITTLAPGRSEKIARARNHKDKSIVSGVSCWSKIVAWELTSLKSSANKLPKAVHRGTYLNTFCVKFIAETTRCRQRAEVPVTRATTTVYTNPIRAFDNRNFGCRSCEDNVSEDDFQWVCS